MFENAGTREQLTAVIVGSLISTGDPVTVYVTKYIPNNNSSEKVFRIENFVGATSNKIEFE